MFTLFVGSSQHARALVKYAAEIGCADAKSSYNEETKWYRIEIECELKLRRQLVGFADGLEYLEPSEPLAQFEAAE